MNSNNKLFDVSGKVAVVTGGTRGIGFMIAKGLVQNGVKTYVVSRSSEACAQAEADLKQYGEAIAIAADLADLAQLDVVVEKILAREPEIDILVNNAGVTWGASFDAFPEAGWDKVIDLNVKSVFFLTQRLVNALKAAGSLADPSRVINIGSVDGISVPEFENYSYSTSKAAVHHLTRHLACDLAYANINVNAIAVGSFKTKMTEFMLGKHGDAIIKSMPRGRLGIESDIVGTVIFLTSAASSFMTGAVIPLDGGCSISR
ncbi:SDR family NAD(P)-dependent oxidoreductase [Pseudomonas carnis]|uniref:SDR family NAD(P)-dependent oxidoreductase n=1 Tax=Pseudomonas carnis TaxID=2487355 RepID=A0ABT5RJ94_9PSED|nr:MULTISPECIES: SDR family NAD(P)-dependent oxidoreductase [Pseudomonas]MBA1252341.1 SDR family NAD(P)-dependent oxidoreductase [Pseudomonas carnis]MBA1270096.1 SDR family NAD(P)-dependent oxidoreductase [Pseudomonas carnis]MBA1301553.1 SDR family NAD(P)-dependent oxidoreductase [Pseudomonas carnis]MBJ2204890.1 SDR family NAD(P)-dependent oxidoreductase [Pseudomonas carnis]MBJ2280575.1 SDR family NAD(P)-dependent oxidoreductase [Pseudomonas sp. MF6767]